MGQCRGCPRNCKRRATASEPLGSVPGRPAGGEDPRARRPAVEHLCFSGRGAPDAAYDHWRNRHRSFQPAPHIDLICRDAALSEDRPMTDAEVTIFVCTNCRDASDTDLRPGIALIEALRIATVDRP